jgi:diguanylate cyclase (GGDEF)-like protein
MPRPGGLLASLPGRARAFVFAISALGAVVFLTALVRLVTTAPRTELPTLAMLAVIMIVAIALKVPVRLGSHHFEFQWLESGFVLGMLMVPGSTPTVVATGVGALVVSAARRGHPVKIVFNSGAFVLAVASGALVLRLAGGTPAGPTSLAGLMELAAAAGVTALVSSVLAYVLMALVRRESLAGLFRRDAAMLSIMYLGNVVVALLAAVALRSNAYYLLGLPILLWLVHQVYEARVNARTEREAWNNLAKAVHALNGLDVNDVVDAAIRGGLTLLSADAVEVTIRDVEDRPVTARGTAAGAIVRASDEPPTVDGTVISYRLSGGADGAIGEFRLCFSGKVSLKERETLTLAAFGDAVSAAVRDALAHGRLRSEAERKVHEAAHDPLTGLVNRAHLVDLGRDVVQGLRSGEAVALAVFGLDHFKNVTNTLGHAVGDQLLRHVADRIGAVVDTGEIVARLGGDEFAVLLAPRPDVRNAAAGGIERTHQLHAALRVPADVAGVTVTVEASAGVAVSDGDLEIEELLRRAHVAMFQAKSSSMSVSIYSADRDAGSVERLSLTTELREAIERDDQLVLYLQPTIDMVSGAPLGAEALIRWQHPRRGLLAPAQFIPSVEKSELVKPFTLHVLELALKAWKTWPDGLDLPISVNLSARCLLDRQLPVEIADLLRRYEVPAQRLVLEITETVMMSELEVVEEVLKALRTVGVQLSVDDFGTGYSSLTFLARVPVHEVKVDHTFVHAMDTSTEAEAIIRLTVEFARTLGLRAIAEGVETAEQQAKLVQLGCIGGQGLHLFAPTPADKVGSALWVAASSAAARGSAVVIPLRGDRTERVIDGRTADQ